MTILKKIRNNKCWRGDGEKGTFIPCGSVNWYRYLWKTVWSILKKYRLELSYHPASTLLGTYLKKQKHHFEKINAPFFHCKFIYSSQYMKTA